MLDRTATLEASKVMSGGLGAIAYAALAGLREGGAAPESVADVEKLMFECYARLPEADCDTLCAVVAERLAADRGPDGRWYGHA